MIYALAIGVIVALVAAGMAYNLASDTQKNVAASTVVLEKITALVGSHAKQITAQLSRLKSDETIIMAHADANASHFKKMWGKFGQIAKHEKKDAVVVTGDSAIVVKPELTPEPEPHHNGFAPRLKNIRERRELSQAEFAKQVGYSAPYISRLENGKVRPSDAALDALSAYLKLDKAYLLNGHPGVKQVRA